MVPPPIASVMVRVSISTSPVSPQTAVPPTPIAQVMAPVPAPPSLSDITRVSLKRRSVSARVGSMVMLSVAREMVTTKLAEVVS